MKNIRLLPKLLGGFLIMSLISVLVSYFGLTGTARLITLLDAVGKNQLPGELSVVNLKLAMTEISAAENTLLARGISEQDRASVFARFYEAEQSADNARKAYEPIVKTPEEAALWDQWKSSWDIWWKEHANFVTLEKSFRAAPSDLLYDQMKTEALDTEGPLFDASLQSLSALDALKNGYAAMAVSRGDDVSQEVRRLSEIGLIAGPILALLLSVSLSFSIARPLARGVAFAALVAGGDFTRKLDVKRKDEVGTLAGALDVMTEKLRGMVTTILESAEQVACSSGEMRSTAVRLADGANSQAASLEETTAAVEDLSASFDLISDNAHAQTAALEQGSVSMIRVQKTIEEVSNNFDEIAHLAVQSVEKAVEGAAAVQQVVGGIQLISDSSEKIGGIITVISEIADQTNLLALNASIEAARAGEHGRGFAVVASEVSKLAERTSASTREINSLIRESVNNVARGVDTAEGSQKAMEQIRLASQKVKEMISCLSTSMTQQVQAVRELSHALESVMEMSRSISAATELQTAKARQVTKAVESVNEITQATASSASEMSSATEKLSGMAQELQSTLGQFKLGDGAGSSGELLRMPEQAFPGAVSL